MERVQSKSWGQKTILFDLSLSFQLHSSRVVCPAWPVFGPHRRLNGEAGRSSDLSGETRGSHFLTLQNGRLLNCQLSKRSKRMRLRRITVRVNGIWPILSEHTAAGLFGILTRFPVRRTTLYYTYHYTMFARHAPATHFVLTFFKSRCKVTAFF